MNIAPDESAYTKKTCPKCGKEQEPSETCVRCGLIFKKYKQPDQRVPVPPATVLHDPKIPQSGGAARKERFKLINILGLLLIVDSTLSLSGRIPEYLESAGSHFTALHVFSGKYLYDTLSAVLLFVSAFALLMRKPWARILVLCLMTLSLGEGLYQLLGYHVALSAGGDTPLVIAFAVRRIAAGSVLYGVFIALLFTRKVKADFYPGQDQKKGRLLAFLRAVALPARFSGPGGRTISRPVLATARIVFFLSVIVPVFLMLFNVRFPVKSANSPRIVVPAMGDAGRTGCVRSRGVHRLDSLLWKQKTGDGIGSCFLATDRDLFFVDRRERLYSVNAATGSMQWNFTGNPVTSNPLLLDDTLYVGTSIGALYALDAATGRERWNFQSGRGQFALNMSPIATAPAGDGDFIYFGNGLGYFYAVDRSTGKEAWKVKTGGAILSSPALDPDTVYFGSGDGKLYALSRSSGNEKWIFDAGGPVYSTPVVTDGLVLFRNEDGNVIAVDAETGNKRWSFEAIATTRASPAVMDGIAYVGDKDGHFFALDVGSGLLKWRFDAQGGIFGSPAAADGVVYFGSRDRRLYALDAASGRELWRYEAEAAVDASPAIRDYSVILADVNGTLYAVSEDRQPAGK